MGIPFESKKRFRINPIEVAIFSVVALIFVKSGYSLLYSRQGFNPVALTASTQDPLSSANGRAPASMARPVRAFSEVDIGCDPQMDQTTVNAKKVRLIGSLCSDPEEVKETPQNVKKIDIIDTSANVNATVFPDYARRKFSTDYIALAPGKNLIQVQYQFKDGTQVSREYTITQN